MRVARVGFLFAIGASLAVMAPGAAPAQTTSAMTRPSFTLTVSPEYTTAGQPTTFRLTVVNTSTPGTTLGSVKVTPPTGFTSPQPTPGSPLRGRTQVQNRTLTLRRLQLTAGKQAQLSITATAPAQCGRKRLHWNTQAFQGTTPSGPQLALNSRSAAWASPCSVRPLRLAVTADPRVRPASSHRTAPTASSRMRPPARCARPSTSATRWCAAPTGSATRTGTTRWWCHQPRSHPRRPPSRSLTRSRTGSGIPKPRGSASAWAWPMTSPPRQALRRGPAPCPPATRGSSACLPGCSKAAPPCISRISQLKDPSAAVGFDALMKIQIPESGDPWGAG